MFLVDSREREETFNLCKVLGINATRTALEVGDFASEKMRVERKTISDLYASLMSHRLQNQLKRFNEFCDSKGLVKFLLVEGNFDTFKQHLPEDIQTNEDLFYGTIASIIVRDNINLIWIVPTEGSSKESMTIEAMKTIYKVSQKIDEGKWGLPRRESLPNGPDMKIVHIASVLRISTTLAERLLQRFGSFRQILLAEDKDLLTITGVGQSTLQRIKRLLD